MGVVEHGDEVVLVETVRVVEEYDDAGENDVGY